jgi:hypothetical protein
MDDKFKQSSNTSVGHLDEVIQVESVGDLGMALLDTQASVAAAATTTTSTTVPPQRKKLQVLTYNCT